MKVHYHHIQTHFFLDSAIVMISIPPPPIRTRNKNYSSLITEKIYLGALRVGNQAKKTDACKRQQNIFRLYSKFANFLSKAHFGYRIFEKYFRFLEPWCLLVSSYINCDHEFLIDFDANVLNGEKVFSSVVQSMALVLNLTHYNVELNRQLSVTNIFL